MAKSASLEEKFAAIEEILNKLEDGNLALEESFRLYKDGMKLAAACNQQLDKVEKQLIVLDGEMEEKNGV